MKHNLTEEQKTTIGDIRTKYDAWVIKSGQLAFSKKQIEETESELEREYAEFRSRELEFLRGLQNQFGDGALDIENGEYITT